MAQDRAKEAQGRYVKLQEQLKGKWKEYSDLRRADKKETDPDKKFENFKVLYQNRMDRAALRGDMKNAADERNEANMYIGVWEHALGR